MQPPDKTKEAKKPKFKKRTYVIDSESIINQIAAFLKSQPKEPVLQIDIYEKTKDRTVDQNRLYRLWGGVISEDLGWTQKDTYTYLRREHLCKIYIRDDQQYAEMVESIRKVWRTGEKQEAEKMYNFVVEKTSTADASVKQFMEYLKLIERDMMDKNIPLPQPKDRYNSALGIKIKKSKTNQT